MLSRAPAGGRADDLPHDPKRGVGDRDDLLGCCRMAVEFEQDAVARVEVARALDVVVLAPERAKRGVWVEQRGAT